MGNRTPPFEKSWRAEVKRLWRAVHSDFDIDVEAREVLRVACDSLESFYQARDTLNAEGSTFTTPTGQVKKHPACEILKNERAGFLAALRQLNLDWGPDKDPKRGPGRPTEYGL